MKVSSLKNIQFGISIVAIVSFAIAVIALVYTMITESDFAFSLAILTWFITVLCVLLVSHYKDCISVCESDKNETK